MKKDNTAEKAALNAEKITKALQEGTEKTLQSIINEAISRFVTENDDEEEGPKDNSFDVNDVEPNEVPEVSDVETGEEAGGEEGGEEAPAPEDGEGAPESGEAEDDWSDMEQYKVGDDDYDFTGVDGEEILKVYSKLGDDDQIFVKPVEKDPNKFEVRDGETGAEFVIELNPEGLDAENGAEGGEGEPAPETEPELGLGGDEEEIGDLGGEEEPGLGDEGGEGLDDDDVIELDINDDKDDLYEENLGYTDNYQKDVFDKKFNMSEPADKKTTYSMDAGAPDGAEKPWAGKGDPKPFEKKVDEDIDECGINAPAPEQEANLEENGGTIASTDARHMKKGQIAQHRPNAPAYDVRKVDSPLSESVKKIVATAKAIQAENKQYKANLDRIKKSLYEAAVLNVNLGRLVDILVNETTTKDEKKSILERFNNVKTISEGKALQATIKAELRESKKANPIVEKQFVAGQSLNEKTIYSNAKDPSLDLMDRMDNLYK